VKSNSEPSVTATPIPYNLKHSSEWGRLDNLKDSVTLWMQHPLLGNGVTPQIEDNNSKGLSQFSGVTWTEVGLESGILGFFAFLFAILANMTLAWKKSFDINLKTLVLVAWLMHFGVQFILSQTFPRLDYWLIFFLSIRLLIKSGEQKGSDNRKA
jgi:O-antigen ligase